MIIAIKGYIGSGKSTISKMLEEKYSFKIIEADKVVHKLYEDEVLQEQIVRLLNIERFDRRLIANMVFQDLEKLKDLENIVHPLLEDEINNFISKEQGNILIDCQVINKLNVEYDYEILSYCSKEEILKRVIKRDNKTREQILDILSLQEKFVVQKNMIFSINTENSQEEIEKNLAKIIKIFTKDKNKLVYEDDDNDFDW